MTAEQIIDGIIKRKEALNASNQQIADASNVPKTTVDRILRKETTNPSFQAVIDIAVAVGYDFQKEEEKPVHTTDEAMQQIIYIYEKRCADLERESRLKTVQTNMIIAGKDRWIKFLTILSIILFSGIAFLLFYDVTHPDVGWIQERLMTLR